VKDSGTPTLTGFSWSDDSHVTTKDGRRLRRWGTVAAACAILDDCDRQTIYDLRDAGLIKAYKPNSRAKNGHLKVDLMSVWLHRQGELARA
jgi:hypothetical protein